MLDKTILKTYDLMKDEYRRIVVQEGAVFDSSAEAFTELNNARREVAQYNDYMKIGMDMIINDLLANRRSETDFLEEAAKDAIKGACKCMEYAAMLEKMKYTLMVWTDMGRYDNADK